MTEGVMPGGADPRRVNAALRLLGERGVLGAPLGLLTTYRVGGPAAIRVDARSIEDLAVVRKAVAATSLPVLVVGRGSNLLVSDAGFGGIAVILGPAPLVFGSIEVGPVGEGGMTPVRAGGAVSLPTLARRTAEVGLTGLEWAVGVPGSVGGGVRMNAGGHGSDVAASLERAWLMDLTVGLGGPRVVNRAELDYGYRRSSVGVGQVVVAAEFVLTPGDRERSRSTIRDIVRWRREHQPGGQNAGSVFTNPADRPAGWLIEAAGLKGRRLRSAMVSPKHANFIQADPGGSADDVRALLELIRSAVECRTGVRLATEVRMIGFSGPGRALSICTEG